MQLLARCQRIWRNVKHRSRCELCGFRFRIARIGEGRAGLKRSRAFFVGNRLWDGTYFCAWCAERVGDPRQLELEL